MSIEDFSFNKGLFGFEEFDLSNMLWLNLIYDLGDYWMFSWLFSLLIILLNNWFLFYCKKVFLVI